MNRQQGSVVHLLANPSARSSVVTEVVDRCAEAIRARGFAVEMVDAKTSGEAEHQARRVADAGAERLVVIGGDGMVHIAVQAAAERDLVLGVIPLGTGNDFAGGLGLTADVDLAIEGALGDATAIDLMRVGDRWAASVATMGFSVAVNARANAMRRPRGGSRYTIATLAELPRLRADPYELVIDGTPHQVRAVVVTIANTSDFGGGMKISPDAAADDGQIDVTVVGATGRLELLLWFRKVFSGTHLDNPKVTTYRGRRVEITTPDVALWADGEPLATSPVAVEVVPGALHLAGLAPRPHG